LADIFLFFRNFLSSHKLRATGSLAIGAALGQGLTFAAAPLLTRLYSASDIGEYGTLLSFISIFVCVICLGYEESILICEEKDIGYFIIISILSALFIIFIFLISINLISLFYVNEAMKFDFITILLSVIFLLANGLYVITQVIYVRNKNIPVLAKFQVIKAIISNSVQILASIQPFRPFGLILGQILGIGMVAVALAKNIWPPKAEILKFFQIKHLWLHARHFSSYPLYRAPQSILNTLVVSMPIIYIGIAFGSYEAGYFWLAYRALGLPNQILVESVRTSLMSEFSAMIRSDEPLLYLLLRTIAGLTLIFIPLSVGLFMFGEAFFGFAFGKNWSEAGLYASILSLAWIFQNAGVPAFAAFTLMRQQGLLLLLEIFGTIMRVTALACSMIWHDIYFILLLFSCATIIQMITTIILCFFHVRQRDRVIAMISGDDTKTF